MVTISGKQEAFAQEYVATDDPVAAYHAAYSTANMSEEAVRVEASRLLNNPKITLRIQQLRDEIHRAQAVAANLLSAEYLNLALADITVFLERGEGGNLQLVDLHALDDWTRRQIKKVHRGKDGEFTIELVDKLKPLEMLARRLREFSPKLELPSVDEREQRFNAAVERIPPEQWETIARQVLDTIPLDVAQQQLLERAKRPIPGEAPRP